MDLQLRALARLFHNPLSRNATSDLQLRSPAHDFFTPLSVRMLLFARTNVKQNGGGETRPETLRKLDAIFFTLHRVCTKQHATRMCPLRGARDNIICVAFAGAVDRKLS